MARFSPVIALAFAAALLLLGCASEPKPETGVQGLVVQNAEGLLGNVQPAKPGQAANAEGQQAQQMDGQVINCTLAVKQATIVAGGSVDVLLSSHFSGSAQFDLRCGNVTRHFFSENTLALETACRFDSPGTQAITASANGRQCASAIIEVRK